MLFPVGDDNPRSITPWLNWVFLGTHIALSTTLLWGHLPPALAPLALRCEPLARGSLLGWVVAFLYLLFAYGFLWIFGDNIEDRWGRRGYATLYAGTGISGVLAQVLWAGGDSLAGAFAQAAISSVVGAYVTLFPHREITFWFLRFWCLYGRPRDFEFFGEIHAKAKYCAGIWLFAQVCVAVVPITSAPPAAGLVGLAAGLVAGFLARKRARAPAMIEELVAVDGSRPTREVSLAFVEPGDAREDSLGQRKPSSGSEDVPFTKFLESEQDEKATSALRPVREPLPVEESEEGPCWAVIRLTDELRDVSLLGRCVARETGEMLAQVTRRLRVTRGLLAHGLPEEAARKLAEEIRSLGLAVAVVSWPREGLPRSERVVSVAWSQTSVAFRLGSGAVVDVPWLRVVLIAAAQIEGQLTDAAPSNRRAGSSTASADLLDVLENWSQREQADWAKATLAAPRSAQSAVVEFLIRAQPREEPRIRRLRITEHWCAFPGQVGGIGGLCRAILQYRGNVPINRGITVLAGTGSWGYLKFQREKDFEDYLAWLLAVLSAGERKG